MGHMTTTIGFIGLGTMGAPMVRNLLKCGHTVIVWARRREAMTPVLAAGATAGESAAHVAATSDVVFTMVTDARAVEEVILAAGGVARGIRACPGVVRANDVARRLLRVRQRRPQAPDRHGNAGGFCTL